MVQDVASCSDIEFAPPPVPPPPPIDCARMPEEPLPVTTGTVMNTGAPMAAICICCCVIDPVVIAPVFATVTSPAPLPGPPKPPTDAEICFASGPPREPE